MNFVKMYKVLPSCQCIDRHKICLLFTVNPKKNDKNWDAGESSPPIKGVGHIIFSNDKSQRNNYLSRVFCKP